MAREFFEIAFDDGSGNDDVVKLHGWFSPFVWQLIKATVYARQAGISRRPGLILEVKQDES
jgi:hypothetical protein